MQITKNAAGKGSALLGGRSISLLCLAVVGAPLCLLGEGVSGRELPQKKRVLVLHGRWGMGTWETRFNTGLHTGVQDDPDMVVGITQEGLGLEYVASNDDLQNVIDHLRHKTESNPVDLVIAVVPTANEFLLSHGETLFPGIPKLFVIPGDPAVKEIQSIPEAVVIESSSEVVLRTDVARIFSLLPDTKHLVVVCGSGPIDQVYLSRAKRAIASTEAARRAQVSYLVGLPLEELLERVAKLEELTTVLFLTYHQDTAKKIKEAGILTFESCHRHKDGRVFPVEVTTNYINCGGEEYVFAFVTDITERKRAEESLAASEHLYRTLFESAGDAIAIFQMTPRGFQYVDANVREIELLGCQREELHGLSPVDFSPPNQPDGRSSSEKALEVVTAALAGETQPFRMETLQEGWNAA